MTAQGRYWMIEPNVGRTEYCVDLAIQSGINLPWIEYCHVTGREFWSRSSVHSAQQRTWFDTDKDPLCYLRNRRRLYGPRGSHSASRFSLRGIGRLAPLGLSLARNAVACRRIAVRFR